MTTLIAALMFGFLFALWGGVLVIVEMAERQRAHRTGLMRFMLGTTAMGAAMMYFGLAVIRSLGQ